MSTQAQPHGFVTRSIHWISALLIGYGYLKGLDNVNQLADPALWRFEVIFASVMGLVFAARMFWTHRIAGATRLPQEAPKWEQFGSRMVHYGLYASVFGIVLSGLGIAFVYAGGISGGIIMGALIGLHELSLAALPILLIAHVAGALWHKVVRRDGILESMTGRLPGIG